MALAQDATGDASFAQTLEAALLNDLQAATPQGINSQVALAHWADDGALMAGLSATTSYGWLRVNMIWVAQQHRRAGYARGLMQQAFDLACDRGCHGAWLETSNPKARDFYHSIGFAEFGRLKNGAKGEPPTHSRWFLKKTLVD